MNCGATAFRSTDPALFAGLRPEVKRVGTGPTSGPYGLGRRCSSLPQAISDGVGRETPALRATSFTAADPQKKRALRHGSLQPVAGRAH